MPAILGLQFVITAIVKVLEWIVSKFAVHMTVRVASSIAYIGVYIAMLAGLATVIASILSGLSYALPAELSEGFSRLKPDNFELCVSAIYSTKVAVWVYQHKRALLEFEQKRRIV